MKTIQLENRAWRGLRVCPLGDILHDGDKYFFSIGGHNGNYGKQIGIEFQKEVKKTRRRSINSQETETYEYMDTVGAGHESFDTFDQAILYLEKRFDVKLEYPKNTMIMRGNWTWEQNIAYAENNGKNEETVSKMSHTPIVLEEVVLDDISKNPQTQKELVKKYGKDLADYTSRWSHDYGQETTPFIEKKLDKWTITENGTKFLNNKEARY